MRKPDNTQRIEEYDDECPTLVARFDIEAYARATATWEEDADAQNDVQSGIRRSFPTLTREIGQLPNEPEEDAIVRTIGGASRVLELRALGDEHGRKTLEPHESSVVALIDGARSLAAVLDASELTKLQTLRVIEELLLVGLVA